MGKHSSFAIRAVLPTLSLSSIHMRMNRHDSNGESLKNVLPLNIAYDGVSDGVSV